VAATVAGLHLRTWFHALPRRDHPVAASFGLSGRGSRPHAKERVPVPALPVHRTRSQVSGLPRALIRPLIQLGFLTEVGSNFKIPILYRAGLEITQGKAAGVSDTENGGDD
jgi:hypothetical protein